MTKDDERRQAALNSIASELFKIAHARKLPDDEEERALDADLDLAAIVRVASNLCPHNVGIVAALVVALYGLQEHEPERAAGGERVTTQ
jgi:hypothetical protein